MKYYVSKSNDPFFNMAFEEYMIKNAKNSLFILYQNKPCVIIGKNQNPHKEVDLKYLSDNNILLCRRNSGGGAVHMDKGNINYSFILLGKEKQLGEFKKLSYPMINFFNEYTKSKVYFSGRNDLLIDGMKFSGTAQMAVNNNLIHHGTLLYDTDFSQISKILTPNKDKLKLKGIKSINSRVTNLKEYLPKDITINLLKAKLVAYHSNSKEFIPTQEALNKIKNIANDKKKSIDFLLKNKANYTNSNVEYIPGFGTIEVCSSIKNNIIVDFEIFGEYFSKKDLSKIKKDIIGIAYSQEVVTAFIEKIKDFSDYFHGLKKDKLIKLILGDKYEKN